MADFDPAKFQQAFQRVGNQRDRLKFEGRQELFDDLVIILEVVYAAFVQSQALTQALSDLTKEIQTMAGELATLQAQVASSITVQESAIQLIQGIKAQLDAAIAANDPVALATLSQNLGTEQGKLAAAIVANTPVVNPPPPPPPPPPPQTALQVAQARGDTTVSQTDTQITLQAADGTQTTYDKTTGAVVTPTPAPTPTPTP